MDWLLQGGCENGSMAPWLNDSMAQLKKNEEFHKRGRSNAAKSVLKYIHMLEASVAKSNYDGEPNNRPEGQCH